MTKNLEHKAQAGEYHSNLFATSVSFATPKRESMAQANSTHYRDMVLLSSRKALWKYIYAASMTPASIFRWCCGTCPLGAGTLNPSVG